MMKPRQVITLSVLTVAVVGYFDYISGFENSMVLLYLAPIAAATWSMGVRAGIVISILSMIAWIGSDIAAGIPHIRPWNVISDFAAYLSFVVVLSLLRTALAETQARVDQQTQALRRELRERRRLEKEIVAVAEHERQRVGRELHDNLSQHLTGTSLFAQGLANRLAQADSKIAPDARKVVDLINRAINLSRDTARGLFSFELDANGLASALDSLASSASQNFGFDCAVERAEETHVSKAVAVHLYWIANEAVSNAGKHAGAERVRLNLWEEDGRAHLQVRDNGHGLSSDRARTPGIGLKVMSQRAQLAGGQLSMQRENDETIVNCEVPVTESDE